MADKFEVISVLGPLGSGKTTTLNHLIEEVPLGESYAVVVNDVGESNIDARRISDHPGNKSETIVPLTAGCIGCSDVTQFREALERVHDAGVNVLFIEPTGIAPGTEIAEVVHSSGFDLSVLTLVNSRTVSRDMKWQVLPSQLAVANIVGITHIPDEQDEAEVVDQVLDQLPPLPKDVTVELIKPGDTDYFSILSQLRGLDRELRMGGRVVDIAFPGAFGHGHGEHGHEHGISAKSYVIKSGVSLDQIRSLLMPYVNSEYPLIRAKGVVGDNRFDIVGDEWNDQPDTGQTQTMNVIFGGNMPSGFLEDVSLLTEQVTIEIKGNKKTIVKSISELPIADRSAIVRERITQYPSPISATHGELIPDCEADEGYEIAFWGNQDDMPSDIKKLAMSAYISFRLEGLHQLTEHPERLSNVTDKQSYWYRRYGAALGYNYYYLSEYIDQTSLDKIKSHNPANLLFEGFMALDSLTFDESRAEEKPEFVASVLKAATEKGDITSQQVQALKLRAIDLSKAKSDFQKRWQSALAFV